MPPRTKSDTVLFLLGQPDAELHPEFLEAVEQEGVCVAALPFKGPRQLPTIEQVLKLYHFLRERVGKKNCHVSPNLIEGYVASHVVKYWKMAGFQTLTDNNVQKHIRVEVEKYKSLFKAKSRSSKTEENKREEFLSRIKTLFDIATPDLENILEKSRLLQYDDHDKRYRAKEGYTLYTIQGK